jgi:tetratricopeptide (TPR) repeat protein
MLPGEIIADRFRIEALAGSGGVGAVYRALDRVTGERVALKVLIDEDADAARFAEEAGVLAEIQHPGVVRYVAHGVTRTGAPWLAMEWLAGESLAARLAREGIRVAESLELTLHAAEALSALHQRGIVHRDVKPGNLFLVGGAPSGVKLLDFGLVRRTIGGRTLTGTGAMVGTPSAMSPEQARGDRSLGPRADVFSLGCVLFECLTGTPAFAAEQLLAVLAKILLEDAPRVRERRPELPAAVDELVASMLSRAPAGRPADGAAVAARIRALGASAESAGPPSLERPPVSLTGDEQRLVSVVWVAAAARGGPRPFAETLEVHDEVPDDDPIARALYPQGLEPERLADGSVVVMVSGRGTATDLAARAARCAITLQGVRGDAEIVVATGRGDLSSRFAVGEVLDRTVALLHRPATGEASLEGVRVDEVTAGLLDARFDVTQDPRGFVLRGEGAGGPARRLLGRATPCVGRERDLRLLSSMFDECVADSAARVALVTAPAGIGKSRLRREWLRLLGERRDRPVILGAHGDSVSAGSAFGLVAQLVRDAAGIEGGEPLSERQGRLRAAALRGLPSSDAARVAAFLGELAGTPFPEAENVRLGVARRDPVAMGDQMRAAWEDFIAARCHEAPVLIVIDDLQWGDLPSVRLLDRALAAAEELPLMVCAFARPEVEDTFPGLWSDRPFTSIRLAPLPRKAGEKLVRAALGEGAAAETVATLVARAEGNAFFLEELIRAVAEGRGEALPGSVLAMVQSRIEGIDPDARLLLRAASVFGQVFPRGGVLSLLGGAQRTARFGDRLGELSARELVEPAAQSRFPGEPSYAFRHAFVREAAYAMLTDADRSLGHRLAGEWLEAAGEREALVLAEHYDRGGSPARAAGWLRRAAQEAFEGGDLEATLALTARAIAAGASGEALGEIHLLECRVHSWRGQPAEAHAADARARALLPRGGPSWCEASALQVMASIQRGDLDGVLAGALELRGIEPAPAAAGAYVMAAAVVVSFLVNLMVMDTIGVFVDRIERLAAAAPEDVAILGWSRHAALHVRGLCHGEAGSYLRLSEEAVSAFDRAGDLRARTFAETQVGAAATWLGAYDRAEAALSAASAAAARFGLGYIRLRAGAYRADLLLRRGRAEEALAAIGPVMEGLGAGGIRTMTAIVRVTLAKILLAVGDLAAAEREGRAAAAGLAMNPLYRGEAEAVVAAVLGAQGRAGEALQAAEGAMAGIRSGAPKAAGEAYVRLVHAEALFAAGRREEAREAIRAAQARLIARAEGIERADLRGSFLGEVPENVRTLRLGGAW